MIMGEYATCVTTVRDAVVGCRRTSYVRRTYHKNSIGLLKPKALAKGSPRGLTLVPNLCMYVSTLKYSSPDWKTRIAYRRDSDNESRPARSRRHVLVTSVWPTEESPGLVP